MSTEVELRVKYVVALNDRMYEIFADVCAVVDIKNSLIERLVVEGMNGYNLQTGEHLLATGCRSADYPSDKDMFINNGIAEHIQNDYFSRQSVIHAAFAQAYKEGSHGS